MILEVLLLVGGECWLHWRLLRGNREMIDRSAMSRRHLLRGPGRLG